MKKVKLEKVIEVFSLEEMLNDPEKKKNFLGKNQLNEFDEETLMEVELEEQTEWVESLGFKGVDIHYDVSCCQGSGASFIFSNVDIKKLIDEAPNRVLAGELDEAIQDGFPNTLEHLLNEEAIQICGTWNHLSNHYTHEKTVDVEGEYPDDVNDEILNEAVNSSDFEKYFDNIVGIVREIYYDVAGELYRRFDRAWDYIHSEESIINICKENGEDLFTEDGRVFNEELFEYPTFNITELEE